ncbi:hypothetical protein ABPG74_021249 [Tetrahymena malaccensis]
MYIILKTIQSYIELFRTNTHFRETNKQASQAVINQNLRPTCLLVMLVILKKRQIRVISASKQMVIVKAIKSNKFNITQSIQINNYQNQYIKIILTLKSKKIFFNSSSRQIINLFHLQTNSFLIINLQISTLQIQSLNINKLGYQFEHAKIQYLIKKYILNQTNLEGYLENEKKLEQMQIIAKERQINNKEMTYLFTNLENISNQQQKITFQNYNISQKQIIQIKIIKYNKNNHYSLTTFDQNNTFHIINS